MNSYLDEVRAELADLPPDVRDELLEDLSDHLAEIAAEVGEGSLAERLGTPAAYAAELRAAAGLKPRGGTPSAAPTPVVLFNRARAFGARILGRVDRGSGRLLGYEAGGEFLRLLRPGWWVLRGYLLGVVFLEWFFPSPWGTAYGVIPRLSGSRLAGIIVTTGAIIASVWLGRRTPALSRWPRGLLGVAGVVLVLFALNHAATVDTYARTRDSGYYGYYNGDPQVATPSPSSPAPSAPVTPPVTTTQPAPLTPPPR